MKSHMFRLKKIVMVLSLRPLNAIGALPYIFAVDKILNVYCVTLL